MKIVIHAGCVKNQNLKQIFYFLPTVCWIVLSNLNKSIIIYWGDLFFEIVIVHPTNVQEMEDKIKLLNSSKD